MPWGDNVEPENSENDPSYDLDGMKKRPKLIKSTSAEIPLEAMDENSIVTEQRKRMMIANWSPCRPNTEHPADREAWMEGKHEIGNTYYAKEIMEKWLEMEKELTWDRDFLSGTSAIRPHMITTLNAWIVEIIYKFELSENSLWHAFTLINRYLSAVFASDGKLGRVDRQNFQMVGSACMWIAAKHCEVNPMCASDLVYVSKDVFNQEQLRHCEMTICKALDWRVDGPNAYDFLRRYVDIVVALYKPAKTGNRIKWLAHYGLERSALEYKLFVNVLPSRLALACLLMAVNCVGRQWCSKLVELTGVTSSEMKPLARKIRNVILDFNSRQHESVIKKYAKPDRGSVSTLRISSKSTTMRKGKENK